MPFIHASSAILIIDDAEDGSEFTEENASTTETEDTKASEDIEDMEEEGLDGVSSEGEKTSGGTETVEVRFNMLHSWTILFLFAMPSYINILCMVFNFCFLFIQNRRRKKDVRQRLQPRIKQGNKYIILRQQDIRTWKRNL